MNLPSPYLQLVIATIIWGGNFVVGRAIADQLPPFSLTFFRWCTALLIFWPFCRKQIKAEKPIILANWWFIAVMALTGITGFNTLLYYALRYTTSINASLVFATSPIIISILAAVILKERLTMYHFLGVGLTLGGVLYIISNGSLSTLINFTFNLGDLMVIIAVISWGFYSIAVRSARQLPLFSSFAYSIIFSLPLITLLFLWEMNWSDKVIVWSWASVAAILYVGIMASIVAFILWNAAVSRLGPARSSIFLNLVPVFASVFAILFNNETLAPYQLIGGLVVILGVYISTDTKKMKRIRRRWSGFRKGGDALRKN